MGYAEAFHKPIYPILAQGNQRTAVPIGLINTDWFDIRQRYSRGIAELIKSLRQLLCMSDTKEIPTTSSPGVMKRKIEEIIKVMGGPMSSGVVKIGRVTLSFGLNAYQKDTGVGYRATIFPVTDSDTLEASRRIELRGWKLGPLVHSNWGNSLTLSRLNKSKDAYVYT